MEQDWGLLLQFRQVDIRQTQHVALRQRVGKLMVALLLHGLHLNFAVCVEQAVDPGVDHPAVALKNAVEHFQAVCGKLPWTVKVVFSVFLFLSFFGRLCIQVHFSAARRGEKSIYLAL